VRPTARSAVPPPRRVDLFGLAAEDACVPWVTRMVAELSAEAARRDHGGVLVDLPDRPSAAALASLRALGSDASITARVFHSWDAADAADSSVLLRACLAFVDVVLVEGRGHLVHLASRGVLDGAADVRISPPRVELAPVAPEVLRGGVLDCRLDRDPLFGVEHVARSRDSFEIALPEADTVLLSVPRPAGVLALVDALVASGRRVVASSAVLIGADARPRPRLRVVDEHAPDADWTAELE